DRGATRSRTTGSTGSFARPATPLHRSAETRHGSRLASKPLHVLRDASIEIDPWRPSERSRARHVGDVPRGIARAGSARERGRAAPELAEQGGEDVANRRAHAAAAVIDRHVA